MYLQDLIESIEGGHYGIKFTASTKYNDYRKWFTKRFNNLTPADRLGEIVPYSYDGNIEWLVDTTKSASQYISETGGVFVSAEINVSLQIGEWDNVPF